MKLYNPYTKGSIDYPLDLSSNNIVLEYHITHETFFCAWRTSWLVLNLESGDVIYIPYGEQNRRDIYIVTPFYLNKEVQFPHGVYTLSYSKFLDSSSINIPESVDNDNNNNNDDNDDDDDDFEDFFVNNFKPNF